MEKKKLRGKLYIYLRWPLYAAIYFVIVTLVINIVDVKASYILGIFVFIFVIAAIYMQLKNINFLEPALTTEIMKAARLQGAYVNKMNIPYAVLSEEARILWANDAFLALGKGLSVGGKIYDAFPDLDKKVFANFKDDTMEMLAKLDDRKYRVRMDLVELNDIDDENFVSILNPGDKVIMIYLYDVTAYYDLKQDYDNSKQVTGFIYIDNYYEIAENMEDSKAAMLIAIVDRKLTRYISYNSGILKKLEKDKYFFVTTKKDIEDMIEDRFSILDQAKEIIGAENNIPLTLSIGVGYEGKSIESNHDLARIAMDLALGRGGDQAVVKKGQETLYFGGKSASATTNARVRARVKSMSFKEILDTKDKVLIMGHKLGDFDSFGACIGTYIMAKHLGKDTHIVVNSLTNAVADMKQKMMESDSYDKKMFFSGDEAVNFADDNTLMILVDHNVAGISDEPRLVNSGLDIVLFDHHRISDKSIKDSILSYIDASASSTCELVAELMIYFEDRLVLRQLEADSMLGGIMIDTLNFTFQTGSKTFDAAAYLKKKGADTDRIRKILRVDMNFEKLKNEIVTKAELYRDGFAIARLENPPENIESSVAKAEIANELINVKGVKASIVLCNENDAYSISSRSIDEVNVQVLMEKLGGGGHRSSAGAVVKGKSFDEAIDKVKAAIDEMIKSEEVKV